MTSNKWAIGPVQLSNPLVLAPMAGVTDSSFRTLVKGFGCALVYTEMISDKGLIFANAKTRGLMEGPEGERPRAVQLFGSSGKSLVQAAQMVEETGLADLIDLNMGCPTPKIVKGDSGAALLRDPKAAAELLQQVVGAVSLPVTVKIRLGWDEDRSEEIALRFEDAGAAAIAVHGRTREQFYSGKAQWEPIAKIRERVKVPVIGNGDVKTPQDARRMLEETGCHGIMVGRAFMGNPWLSKEILTYLETGKILPPPSPDERLAMALKHLAMVVERKGERQGIREMRKHLCWYLRGLPGGARVREQINRLETRLQVENLLLEYEKNFT
jgi:tRNA-dihydrouridine synthase B